MTDTHVPSVPSVPSVPYEVEVFRITPIPGKYYATTTYTRTTGTWSQNNKQYYSMNPIIYVGKFIQGVTTGYGDGSSHYDIFEKNGKTELVHYTYEGTTSFIEIPDDCINIFETDAVQTSQPSTTVLIPDILS